MKDGTTTLDDLIVKAVGRNAFLVEVEGEDQWIPFSQLVSPERDEVEVGETLAVEVPTWLARKFGIDEDEL